MNRYKLIGAVVIVAIIGFIFFRRQSGITASASTIETAKAQTMEFVRTVSSSGKTAAKNSVDLRFLTSGKLQWVGVKEGDRVSQYQTIARLDARDVQKTFEKTLKDYSKQRNTFEQSLSDTTQEGRVPRDALTQAIRRIYENNQWDLERSVIDVELKSLALEYASLVTPISGIVSHLDAPVAGVNIVAATTVFQIIDPSSIVFEAKIDEVDVGTLTVGQKATVLLDAYPDATFSGVISSVAYAAETSAGGATVFPVTVKLDSLVPLRVGFNGDVTIVTERLPGQLVVPSTAIRDENGSKYVLRKSGDTYAKVRIKTGASNDDQTVILSGLNPGDDVVIKGFNSVTVTP